ncbi:MAG: hypothetical protein QM767_24405 [Anaeromyxobacter sp.]
MKPHELNNEVLPARRLTQAIGAWARALLPSRDQELSPAETSQPAPVTQLSPSNEAKTLDSMGVPDSLAREFELYFELMGNTRGEQVVGYTFRTPDGQEHTIRTARKPVRSPDYDRAA